MRRHVLLYDRGVDFSAPYQVITPTLEGPILSALADVKAPLTRGQIVDVVGDASEAGVRKAVARLVEQGIVIEQRLGKRYAYVANREHLLWPSIEGLFGARGLLQERVEGAIAEWEFAPASVELFGSVARGGSDVNSDIDLLIVRPDLPAGAGETWDKQVADLHDQIIRWTGNACDIVVLDPQELERAHDQDEPILRPPTSHVAGAPLAALLSQPSGSLAKFAQMAAGDTALRVQLKGLAEQVSKWAAVQQSMGSSFAAVDAQMTGARAASAAMAAQLDSLRPVLAIDTSAFQAAARALATYESTGVIDGTGE